MKIAHAALIAAVIAANRWQDESEVTAYVTNKHAPGETGEVDADPVAVAAELAQAKPHWVKPPMPIPTPTKPGVTTGVTGNPAASPITPSIDYKELMRPTNRDALADMMRDNPAELERLRTSHYAKRLLAGALLIVSAFGAHGCGAVKGTRASVHASCMGGLLKAEGQLDGTTPTPGAPGAAPIVPLAKPVVPPVQPVPAN